ncbi:hypothetical protein [Pseudogemmobacter sonorensis]|uniref:hypothetical protein n=1 Tax=Pseudogemmobacter sonorensis TaxID=2989681 RepID=UPI0036B8F2F2
MTEQKRNPVLPQGVGPHEGREFALMREGRKNVALFSEIEPEGLEEILAEGFCLFKFPQFSLRDRVFFAWIVFRDGFEGDALRLRQLLKPGMPGIDPAREHEIGRILSYSEEEVEAFLRHLAARHGRKPPAPRDAAL